MNDGTRLVQFERIPEAPGRKPRSHLWKRVVPTLLIVTALVGVVAASNLVVNQKTDTSTVFAERYSLAEQFSVGKSAVWVAKAQRAEAGTAVIPVEMTAGLPEARTFLPADQWVYSVPVTETLNTSVSGGNFTIELFVDELSIGTLHITQQVADPAAIEGVTASFALGPSFSTSSLYYVVVKPFVQTGPVLDLTLKSNPDGSNTWVGVGGTIDGQTNPTLTVPLGTTLRLTANNGGDDMSHNIGIKDAAGANAVPTSAVFSLGGSGVVAWTPTVAGTYTYLCTMHATMTTGTMKGTITVGA